MTPQTNTDKVKEETIQEIANKKFNYIEGDDSFGKYITDSQRHGFCFGMLYQQSKSYTPSEVNTMLEKLRERCQQKWIDVKDKLPEHDQEVNVILANGRVKISTFRINNNYKSFYCGDSFIMSYYPVTHWAALPESILSIDYSNLLNK